MKRLLSVLVAASFLFAGYLPAWGMSAEDMQQLQEVAEEFDEEDFQKLKFLTNWSFYGEAKVDTFWVDYDEDRANDITASDADRTQLDHDLAWSSLFGARADYGDFGGHAEFQIDSDQDFSARLLYGTYDMDELGELQAGKMYAPYSAGSLHMSQMVGHQSVEDVKMLTHTGYSGRQVALQYGYEDFKFALVRPQVVDYVTDITGEFVGGDPVVESADFNPEIQVPQLQASYNTDLLDDRLYLNLAGAFQTYDVEDEIDIGVEHLPETDPDDEGTFNIDDTLDAWAVNADLMFEIMQGEPHYVNIGGFYGENVGNFGQALGVQLPADMMTTFHYADATIDWVEPGDPDKGGELSIEDTETLGGILVLGTEVQDIGLEAGFGYRESDNDAWAEKDSMTATYLQAAIPLLENPFRPGDAVILRPEIGHYDYRDVGGGSDTILVQDGAAALGGKGLGSFGFTSPENPDADDDAGSETYFGLQTRINF